LVIGPVLAVVGMIGLVLPLIFVGVIILALLFLWHPFRVIRGLIRAIDGQPVADPTGWL
jgi:uncharacterized membrane protein